MTTPIKPVVFASVALATLTSAVILPILAPLVRSLHLTVQQGGWMLSISSLAMAAMAAPWGLASDRWGRRRVLLIGFAGMFMAYVLFTAVVRQGLSGLFAGTGVVRPGHRRTRRAGRLPARRAVRGAGADGRSHRGG